MIGPMLNRKGIVMDLLGHGIAPCPARVRCAYMDGVNEW